MVRTLEGSKVEDDEKVAADLLVVKLRRFEDSSTLPARPADGGDWQLGDLTRLSPRIEGICPKFVSYFVHGCKHLVPFDILNVGFHLAPTTLIPWKQLSVQSVFQKSV